MFCSDACPAIANNRITGNNAIFGGGIYCYGIYTEPSISIINNDISGNTADEGGGVYVYNKAHISAVGNTLSGNMCYGYGGGIMLYSAGSASSIRANIISGNTASDGGAICCDSASASILNNLIVDNTATGGTGGIVGYLTNLDIINNTVCYNTGIDAGGVFSARGSVVNNIIAFNSSGVYYEPGMVFTNNCLYGNGTQNYIGPEPDPNLNNLISNPLFADMSNSDFRLQSSSPCIDAGSDDCVTWNTDLADSTRRQGLHADIGAYETPGCPWYGIRLTSESQIVPVNGTVELSASVYDVFGNPVPNCAISFSVASGQGTINPLSSSTGSSGEPATTQLTGTAVGFITVQASMHDSCLQNYRTDNVKIRCYDPATVNDWPMFQHDVAHTGVTSYSLSSNLQKKWVKVLSCGGDTGVLWSSPVTAYGLVYVGTDAGDLYIFDADDGDEMARTNLRSAIHGTPCVYDGKVYVGTKDGVLHVLSAADLSTDWTLEFPGESITGGVTVYNGAVYVGAYTGSPGKQGSGRLHVIDLNNHQERAGSPATIIYGVDYTTPAIDAGFISGPRCYVSDYSCWITALGCADGSWIWEWSRDFYEFFSSPTISGGYIFVGSHENGLYRIIDNGNNYLEPSPYMYTDAGRIINSTAAARDGKLYFGTDSGNICRIDAATFTAADWITNLGGDSVTGSPLISDPTGILFTATDSGAVYALDTSTGAQTLIYDISQDLGSMITRTNSSLVTADGRLFIVAGDGDNRYLYCFGP